MSRAVGSTSTSRPRSCERGGRPKPPRPRYAKPLAAGNASTSTTSMQADKGADLDFLVGSSGDEVTRDSH